MSDAPRGAPVTLEEMTRRRDGWRVRCDRLGRELRAALARERVLIKRINAAEQILSHADAEIRRWARTADGATAEARRYALECGQLRDELAHVRESMSAVCDDCCARIAERLRDRVAQAVGFIDE